MLAFSSFCPFNMNLRINIYVFLFDTAHLTTCTHTLTFHTFLMNKCAFNLSLFFLIKIRNCLFAYVFPSQLPFLKILNTLNRNRNRNQTYKCSSHFIRSQCTHVQNSRLIWLHYYNLFFVHSRNFLFVFLFNVQKTIGLVDLLKDIWFFSLINENAP